MVGIVEVEKGLGVEQRDGFLKEVLHLGERRLGMAMGCVEIRLPAKEVTGAERRGVEQVVVLYRIFCIVSLPEHFTSVAAFTCS